MRHADTITYQYLQYDLLVWMFLDVTKSSGQYVLREHRPMQICTSHSWWTCNHPKTHGINSIQLRQRWYRLISHPHLLSQIYKSNKINTQDTTSNQQKRISVLLENKWKHVPTSPSQQKESSLFQATSQLLPPQKKPSKTPSCLGTKTMPAQAFTSNWRSPTLAAPQSQALQACNSQK